MSSESVRVLLIHEWASSSSHLSVWLERRGCRCQVATSFAQAAHLLIDAPFELIISVLRPQPGEISALATLLKGTHSDFFYAHPVEDGCWWLPAVRSGELSSGSPAMRSSEFFEMIDRLTRQIPKDKASRQVSAPQLVVRETSDCSPHRSGARSG